MASQNSREFQGGCSISRAREIGEADGGTAVSLLFAAGRRPDLGAIRQLAENRAGFSISFDPSEDSRGAGGVDGDGEPLWVELLANGMTFDLAGLAPGVPAPSPPHVHSYALSDGFEPFGMEALIVRPGPHLAGGHAMVPVVRSLASLAGSLAQLAGVEAIAWHPARSWCGPEYFREGVLRWVEGGVFPGLGLTALVMMPDGGMQSEGLSLFTGQELRLEPELLTDRTEGARIGVRLLDLLVECGRIDSPRRISGPDGLPLELEPSANGRFVRVRRG